MVLLADLNVDEITILVGLIGSAIGGLGTFIVNVINARGKNSEQQIAALSKQKDEIAAVISKNLDDTKAELKETRALYFKCMDERSKK